MGNSNEKDKKGQNRNQYLNSFGQAGQVAVTLLANTIVGLFLGRFLDKFFGTKPWLTIIFLLLGIAAGFWGTYKLGIGKER